MNLPRWSLRFPVTAGMAIVALVLMGGVASQKLALAFLPDVDFPGLEIQIPYPNALPAQVEEEIVRPAEEALSTLSRVRRIESWSSANNAQIFVQFDWGEDIGPLRVEAREKLERIRDQLPDDVDVIQVNGFRSSDIPGLECRISAVRDLSRDFEMLDRNVADPLRRVEGVAKVELYGVEPPQVQIDFRLLRDHLRPTVSIHLTHSSGTCVLASLNARSANLVDDEWANKPHPAGSYRATCRIPANFLNEGRYSVNVLMLTDMSHVDLRLDDAVSISAHDTGEMRQEWQKQWIGVVRPRLAWQTFPLEPAHA